MHHSSGETTHSSTKTITFQWKISNFSFCDDEPGAVMQSSDFPLGTTNEKWCLRIYPGGFDAASKRYVSLYLMLKSTISNDIAIKCTYTFHLLNTRGEIAITSKCPEPKTLVHLKGEEWGCAKFIKRKYLFDDSNQLLANDLITIYCEIDVLYPTIPTAVKHGNESNQLRRALVNFDVSESFGELLKNQQHTDIVFCIEGQELKAHKCILASRSPVFQAMLEHDFKESQTNKVEIIDIKYDVFKAMLHFIYSDEVANWDMAKELLMAADKYALNRLKALCEKEISENLTTENSAEVLILADLHSCQNLKSHTLEFITTNANIVIDTAGWKSLEKTHQYLVAEAFRKLAELPFK